MDFYSWTMTCSECKDYTVRVVGGEGLRDRSLDFQEFGLLAIHEDFPELIPENEIWLGERLAIGEFHFVIAGAVARLQALKEGKSSGEAYDAGLKADKAERAKAKGSKFEGGEGEESARLDDMGYIVIPGDGSEPPIKVFEVDGGIVRSHYKIDFLEGGNHSPYSWVPEYEIWIEATLDPDEMPVICLHEYTERLLMLRRGLDYDKAHELASRMEFAHRGHFTRDDLAKVTQSIIDYIPNPQEKRARLSGSASSGIAEKYAKHLHNASLVPENFGQEHSVPNPPRRTAEREVTESLLVRTKGFEQTPDELKRAKKVDLIRFPPGVDGTRCSNCMFLSVDGYCYHQEVDQIIPEPTLQCCKEWDFPGTIRTWDQRHADEKAMSALNETTGGALVAPPEWRGPPIPKEEDRGQRGGLMKELRAKYRGKDGKDIPWAHEEDEYRGLR